MWSQLDLLLDRETQEAEREFYGLIGLVCVRYSHLEKQLTELLRTLIHPDNYELTYYLTCRLQAWKLIELIYRVGLARNLDEDLLENLVSEAKTLKGVRNFYVHGIWDVEVLQNGRVQARCSKLKDPIRTKVGTTVHTVLNPHKTEVVTLTRLKWAAEKLDELLQSVATLQAEIKDEPGFYF